jgi:Nif-specific regulatory protein
MPDHCRKTEDECYGKKELSLLFDISSLLNQTSRDLTLVFKPVTGLLAKYLQADKVFLSILNRTNARIYIDVSHGLTDEEQRKGVYKIGEGINGKVIETGLPVVIPNIAEDSNFLNRTGSAGIEETRATSFICVPIKEGNETIGTLSMFRKYNHHITFAEDARILSIVGSLIAQTVRNRQEYVEELARLEEENLKLHDELKERIHPANMIGNSGKIREVFRLIDMVAPTSSTVLIRGESGVGKELIADAIHFTSLRKNHPFIKVNCAALPESLIESELFGHEKGAFTGANLLRKGRFEVAEGGTIFLDEIGDLPVSTQIKLLRVIQQREFERIGSTKSIQTDVRLICATNRNLEDLIEKCIFREDLYYRINVFPVYVPSLRERINDVPGLVDHFITKFNKVHNKSIKRISSSAIDMLMVYHWPGNIRELENCIERACILSTDNVIRAHNLPPTLQTSVSSGTKSVGTLDSILGRIEKQIILETLLSTKGNLSKAAGLLGITERKMGIRIRKYEIDTDRFKLNRKSA